MPCPYMMITPNKMYAIFPIFSSVLLNIDLEEPYVTFLLVAIGNEGLTVQENSDEGHQRHDP